MLKSFAFQSDMIIFKYFLRSTPGKYVYIFLHLFIFFLCCHFPEKMPISEPDLQDIKSRRRNQEFLHQLLG